jgi:hypothetical protein
MPLRSPRLVVAVVILSGGGAAVAPAIEPPPVVFEGLGLTAFEGAGSVAAALREVSRSPTPDPARPPLEFTGVAVRGPTGPNDTPGPLAAEIHSRVDRIDMAAGLLADPAAIDQGPSRWTGRIAVASHRETGQESLEVRTMLTPGHEQSLFGVAVGPRVERRLGKGIIFFLDGQAEAQAMRPAESGWWTLPGSSTADLTMLGVTARTGLVR